MNSKKSLNTDADKVYLSYATLESHVHKHKEVNAFDYYLTQYMIEYPHKERSTKEFHIIYHKKLGFHYQAAFKRAINDEGEDEIYLQMIVKGSKNYPN